MSSVVCNVNCKYRKAVYCDRDFVVLNSCGQCDVWYSRDGRPRREPYYRDTEKKQEENEISTESNGEDIDIAEQTDTQGGIEA